MWQQQLALAQQPCQLHQRQLGGWRSLQPALPALAFFRRKAILFSSSGESPPAKAASENGSFGISAAARLNV